MESSWKVIREQKPPKGVLVILYNIKTGKRNIVEVKRQNMNKWSHWQLFKPPTITRHSYHSIGELFKKKGLGTTEELKIFYDYWGIKPKEDTHVFVSKEETIAKEKERDKILKQLYCLILDYPKIVMLICKEKAR